MNIKIEEVINLVKSNGVKRFKFKDNKSELELDFTEGYQSSNVFKPKLSKYKHCK